MLFPKSCNTTDCLLTAVNASCDHTTLLAAVQNLKAVINVLSAISLNSIQLVLPQKRIIAPNSNLDCLKTKLIKLSKRFQLLKQSFSEQKMSFQAHSFVERCESYIHIIKKSWIACTTASFMIISLYTVRAHVTTRTSETNYSVASLKASSG